MPAPTAFRCWRPTCADAEKPDTQNGASITARRFAFPESGFAAPILAQIGNRRVKIPDRTNRAVIFDFNLFHKTDKITFADGYENRRINIIMLYGRRRRG